MMSLDEAYERITEEERQRSFLITDPRQTDNPIVFANDAFVDLTGYSRDEILGRNCRFLQGEDTDPATVGAIRTAIESGKAITVDILNYKKDGTPFLNRLSIRPIVSDNGEIDNFVGVQYAIDESEFHAGPISPSYD